MLDSLQAADAALLRGVLALPHPEWLNLLMKAASNTGGFAAPLGALGFVLLLFRRIASRDFVRLVIAVAIVHLVIDLAVKPLVDRARPSLGADVSIFVDTPSTESFPSGHAASAVAAAAVLSRAWKRGRALIWTMAAVFASARVYLGVHYPLDAVAGCAIGWACAAAATSLGRRTWDLNP